MQKAFPLHSLSGLYVKAVEVRGAASTPFTRDEAMTHFKHLTSSASDFKILVKFPNASCVFCSNNTRKT